MQLAGIHGGGDGEMLLHQHAARIAALIHLLHAYPRFGVSRQQRQRERGRSHENEPELLHAMLCLIYESLALGARLGKRVISRYAAFSCNDIFPWPLPREHHWAWGFWPALSAHYPASCARRVL